MEQQSMSSYLLPIGKMAKGVLNKLNVRIASLQVGMQDMTISKLIPHVIPRPRKYYHFQGDSSSQVLLLPKSIIEQNFGLVII